MGIVFRTKEARDQYAKSSFYAPTQPVPADDERPEDRPPTKR